MLQRSPFKISVNTNKPEDPLFTQPVENSQKGTPPQKLNNTTTLSLIIEEKEN